ncbi:MAG: VPLPA-CTERM sorting domain-containing protein [Desulfamplus sp.]|nr:VPLPA-CTERM sorting domain-containing protein [Desulfamplus sp.]
MKNIILAGLTMGLIMLAMVSSASAVTTILIDQGASWDYKVSTSDTWLTGNAAFGNSYPAGGLEGYIKTDWAADTDLDLKKTFNISGTLNGDATLNVAADNGVTMYLNDNLIADVNAERYTNYWEYTITVPRSYFTTGSNLLTVLAEDHGGATFFDMKLTADVNPVPVPAAVWLFGSGLVGLAAFRRKKTN